MNEKKITRVETTSGVELFINRFTECYPSLHTVSARDCRLAVAGDGPAFERVQAAVKECSYDNEWPGEAELENGILSLIPYVGDRWLEVSREKVIAHFEDRPSLFVASNLAHGWGSSARMFFDQEGELIEDVHEFLREAEEEQRAEEARINTINSVIPVDIPPSMAGIEEDEVYLGVQVLEKLRSGVVGLLFTDDEEEIL